MAADRGAFVDQSQSLNVHIAQPNYGKLTSMHFFGWKLVRRTLRTFTFYLKLYCMLCRMTRTTSFIATESGCTH